MKWLPRSVLSLVAAAGLGGAALSSSAHAEDLLILSEEVPVSLNYDGATGSVDTNWVGWDNILDPLVYHAKAGVNEDGVQLLDFNKFESRLAESWSFDEATLTWTFNLRKGVKGCDGATFNADDVIYTFARAKSISGSAPIGWFLASTGSVDGFTPAVFAPDESGAEALVGKLEGGVCPSSKHLGRLSLFCSGGFGSSWFDVKPPGVDGSSGGSGWSVF